MAGCLIRDKFLLILTVVFWWITNQLSTLGFGAGQLMTMIKKSDKGGITAYLKNENLKLEYT